MDNKAIILHSKENDHELIVELRRALIKKGFEDINKAHNDAMESWQCVESVIIWHDDKVGVHTSPVVWGCERYIPVSRNDFQTMFLLY